MGVLGNNAQNPTASLLVIIESPINNQDLLAVSGYADGQVPKDPKTGEKPIPPDGDLKSEHPNATAAAQPTRPGVTLNKFGLRPDITLRSVPGAMEAAFRQEKRQDQKANLFRKWKMLQCKQLQMLSKIKKHNNRT